MANKNNDKEHGVHKEYLLEMTLHWPFPQCVISITAAAAAVLSSLHTAWHYMVLQKEPCFTDDILNADSVRTDIPHGFAANFDFTAP